MDVVVVVVMVGAFALLVTTHVGLAFALVIRARPWRAIAAFLLPPAAPFVAWDAGLRFWPAIWLLSLVVYAIALIAAQL